MLGRRRGEDYFRHKRRFARSETQRPAETPERDSRIARSLRVWSLGGLALLLVSYATLSQVTSTSGQPAPPVHDHATHSHAALDVSGGPCGDLIQLPTGQCTHGPDPLPPGLDGSPAEPVLSAATTDEQVVCDGDGVSGKRVQVLYVRASDVTSRYATFQSSIRIWAANVDDIYANNAASTGGSRHIRFVTESDGAGGCRVTVPEVVVGTTGDDGQNDTIAALSALGWNSTSRVYLIYLDAALPGICGDGTATLFDTRHAAANLNNSGPSYARVSNVCWAGVGPAAHELGHTLGAVPSGAPHSSGGGHCTDEYDIMCYSDSPYYPALTYPCASFYSNSEMFDCGKDDYYNTNPAPGSYLASNWNVADSQFLIGASDPPRPVNDDFANALPVTTKPFQDTRDVQAATVAGDDPPLPTSCAWPGTAANTIWYKVTPTYAGVLTVQGSGTSYSPTLSIWTGSRGSLTLRACDTSLNVQPGTTYYVLVQFWNSGSAGNLNEVFVREFRVSIDAPVGTPPPTATATAPPTRTATATQTPTATQTTATPSPTATITPTPTATGTSAPPSIVLDKQTSKFNGWVSATLTGFAPWSEIELTWEREYEIVSGPSAGLFTERLALEPTDANGNAQIRFRTPLEPFSPVGDPYVITATDASGGTATAELRVIPRIMLNQTSGPPSARLRVYFYGFAPNESIEVRWHDDGTSRSSYVVVKTIVVAANGRASTLVPVPANQNPGPHLIVGSVVGARRSASTTFNLTIASGLPSRTPTLTSTATGTPTATPSSEPTSAETSSPVETPTLTVASPTETSIPTETPVPIVTEEPTSTSTVLPPAEPTANG